MTELPEPCIVDKHYRRLYYTADQMRDYGRAEYLRGIEDAALEVEKGSSDFDKHDHAQYIRALGSKT